MSMLALLHKCINALTTTRNGKMKSLKSNQISMEVGITNYCVHWCFLNVFGDAVLQSFLFIIHILIMFL